MTPRTLILLANLGRPRRPAGAAAARGEPVLADADTAARQLAGLVSAPITPRELPALRRVQRAAVDAVDALIDQTPVDCAAVNALARPSTGRVEITTGDGGALRRRLVWHDPTPSSYLARGLVEELAALDPSRVRRCARAECDLVFYDTTRSRTGRWHAEDPCGWRERHRHRRDRHTRTPPG